MNELRAARPRFFARRKRRIRPCVPTSVAPLETRRELRLLLFGAGTRPDIAIGALAARGWAIVPNAWVSSWLWERRFDVIETADLIRMVATTAPSEDTPPEQRTVTSLWTSFQFARLEGVEEASIELEDDRQPERAILRAIAELTKHVRGEALLCDIASHPSVDAHEPSRLVLSAASMLAREGGGVFSQSSASGISGRIRASVTRLR